MALIETLQDLLPKNKSTGKEATDTANEKWFHALDLLFKACQPLTYDSKLTAEEIKERSRNIEKHTFYCLHVKFAIEDGFEPLSWDEWSGREQHLQVSAKVTRIGRPGGGGGRSLEVKVLDPINIQEFSDDLTDMFGGDYPTKTPKKKNTNFRSSEPLGDDVRMTAKYGRRDEDDPEIDR